MPDKRNFFDNTRLKDHRNCNRYFYLRHELGWSAEGSTLPLAFGGSWHSAMDSVWHSVCLIRETNQRVVIDDAYEQFRAMWRDHYELPFDEDMTPDQIDENLPRTNGVALNMIAEYVANRWEFLNEIELIEVEKAFAVPMPSHPDVFYVGRLDKVFERRGELFVGEHKTSSLYKKNGPFRTDFVQSFSPNSQVDGYIYAASLALGKRVRGCMIDAALVHKTVHDGFQWIPIIRSDSAIDAWLYDAEREIESIIADRDRLDFLNSTGHIEKDKILRAFRKNSEHCIGKYGPCMFLPVCKGSDNPYATWHGEPPQDMIEKRWEPFDFYHLERIVSED